MFLNPGSEVEDIVAIRGVDYVVVQLAMEGKFDAKIAEYKALKDSLDAKKQIADTIEMAEKLKSDAQSKSDEVAAKAKAVEERETAVADLEKFVTAKEANAEAKSAEALRVTDEATAKMQQSDETLKQAQSAIDAREQSVIHQLAQLATDREALEAQKKAFNAKLEALRQ